MTEEDLSGKVALVTGSSRGIGAATARCLANAGARVVINSSSSTGAGEALAAELPDALYIQGNVADETEARTLIEETVERCGRLDVLVNNAGVTRRIRHSDFMAATPEIWRNIFDVNVIGLWQVTVASIPHLREAGDASIINIASLAGMRPGGSSIPYAVSKAAVCHLTRLLANVLGPDIRVNAVAPGLIDTDLTTNRTTLRERVGAEAPLRRVGTAEEVAEAVLATLSMRYMTGEIVVVDGGFGLR